MWWVPEHRGKGLAAAALARLYQRLKPLGAAITTGSGDGFCQAIGYTDKYQWLHFRKA